MEEDILASPASVEDEGAIITIASVLPVDTSLLSTEQTVSTTPRAVSVTVFQKGVDGKQSVSSWWYQYIEKQFGLSKFAMDFHFHSPVTFKLLLPVPVHEL